MHTISAFPQPRIFNYVAPTGQIVGATAGVTSPLVFTELRSGCLISCTGGDATVTLNGATVPSFVIGTDETGQYIPFDEQAKLLLTCAGTVTVLEYKG